MIIFENKGYQTDSDFPNTDWTGNAKYIVEDGTDLANKIISLYPYYDFVIKDGNLVDVIEVEHEEPEPIFPEPLPTTDERITELENCILELAEVLGGAE